MEHTHGYRFFRTNLEHVSAPFVTSQRADFKKCINPLRSEASIRREGRGSLSTGRIHIWEDDVDFALTWEPKSTT